MEKTQDLRQLKPKKGDLVLFLREEGNPLTLIKFDQFNYEKSKYGNCFNVYPSRSPSSESYYVTVESIINLFSTNEKFAEYTLPNFGINLDSTFDKIYEVEEIILGKDEIIKKLDSLKGYEIYANWLNQKINL